MRNLFQLRRSTLDARRSKTKAKKLFQLPLLLLLLLLPFLLFPSPASAQIIDWTPDNGCSYIYRSGSGSNQVSHEVATIQGLECLVNNFLAVAITLIGLGVFVALIIGAFKLLTAGGDPKAAEGAKGTITAAVIGLVIAISAFIILNLIAEITGAPGILRFNTQVEDTQPLDAGDPRIPLGVQR